MIEIFSCSRRSCSRRAASRCCSCSTRARTASSVAVSARPPGAVRRWRRAAPAVTTVGPGAARLATVRRRRRACAGGGGAARGVRFLRTSTCTTLERPWLKLCRTEPASTVRPTSDRVAGRRDSRPLPVSVSLVSLILPVPFPRPDRQCRRGGQSPISTPRRAGRAPLPHARHGHGRTPPQALQPTGALRPPRVVVHSESAPAPRRCRPWPGSRSRPDPVVQPLARPLEPVISLSSPPRQPDQIRHPPHQVRLRPVGSDPGEQRRARVRPAQTRSSFARFLTHPAARSTRFPVRAALHQVRDDLPLRPDDEPQHPLAIAMLARDDAAPQRAGLRLVSSRLGVVGECRVGRVSRGAPPPPARGASSSAGARRPRHRTSAPAPP